MAGLRVFISFKQIFDIVVQTSINLYFNLKDTSPVIRALQSRYTQLGGLDIFSYFFYRRPTPKGKNEIIS